MSTVRCESGEGCGTDPFHFDRRMEVLRYSNMLAHLRGPIFAVLACVFVVFPSRSDVKLPDPAEGNVKGLQGVNFFPQALVDGEPRIMDPTGCTVYLVPSDVNQRLGYDCGKWFAPPAADRYTVWLEQDQRISDQTVLSYSGSKFSGHGLVTVMPLESAGFAALSADTKVGEGQTVRFLSLEESSSGFDKRLQPREAKSMTRLPEGRAMSGVFDSEGNALALSRPFTMKEGKTVSVTPKPPVNAADLMIILGKHQATATQKAKRNTSMSAEVGETRRDPDVMYETDGRIIAIWYGLTANTATVTITSEIFRLGARAIPLTVGRVITVREQLDLK
jgi:hypothetical protein